MAPTAAGLAALVGVAAPHAFGAPPTFTTLDRMDTASRLGIQVGFHKPDVPVDAWGLRLETYGQYVFGRGTGGLYGQFPISYLAIEGADNEVAVQNFELGGFFLFGSPGRRFVLRGGVSLPTADEDPGGYRANYLTSWERIADYAGIVPDTTWLRVSLSPLVSSGRLLFRGDVGLDLPMASGTGPLARASGGFGLLMGSWAILLELANTAFLDGIDEGSGGFIHTLSVGARILGSTAVHFGLVLPLDDGVRGDIFILSLGVQGS